MGVCSSEVDEFKKKIRRQKKIKDIKTDNEKDILKAVHEIFIELDQDHDGLLTDRDIRNLYRRNVDRQLKKSAHSKMITEDEYVRSYMRKADKKGEGVITFDEFFAFYKSA